MCTRTQSLLLLLMLLLLLLLQLSARLGHVRRRTRRLHTLRPFTRGTSNGRRRRR